jgi:putative SOS response-associated peptidase YedK
MCFSVNVNLVKEELENRYGVPFLDPDNYRPSYYYHAFSLPELPAICSEKTNEIQLLRWGLIPSWTKSAGEARIVMNKTFNARGETIRYKPIYSGSFNSKRCIIPVRGFFEWQHTGKEKKPWYIYHHRNDIMSIAGLYDEWTNIETGEYLRTFSIITTEANDLLAVIHNSKKRMPVILDEPSEKKWIDLSASHDDAQGLLRPFPSKNLRAHTISPLVSSRTKDKNTPAVIQPYDYPAENLLF